MRKIAIIVVSILFIIAMSLLLTGKVSLFDDNQVSYDECVKSCQEKHPAPEEGEWSNGSALQWQSKCIRTECEDKK